MTEINRSACDRYAYGRKQDFQDEIKIAQECADERKAETGLPHFVKVENFYAGDGLGHINVTVEVGFKDDPVCSRKGVFRNWWFGNNKAEAEKCAQRWTQATGKEYAAELVEINWLTRNDYRIVEKNREVVCTPSTNYSTHQDNPAVYDVKVCLNYLAKTLGKPYHAVQIWERDDFGLYAYIEFREGYSHEHLSSDCNLLESTRQYCSAT